MKHSEFTVGIDFWISDKRFRCTDIGRRTIIAIAPDKVNEIWNNGPPYALLEIVIDETDIPACTTLPTREPYEGA